MGSWEAIWAVGYWTSEKWSRSRTRLGLDGAEERTWACALALECPRRFLLPRIIAPAVPASMLAMLSTVSTVSRKRPRGLWKGRRDAAAKALPRISKSSTPTHAGDADDDDLFHHFDDDLYSSSSGSSKRRRFSGPSDFHCSDSTNSDISAWALAGSRSLTPLSDDYVRQMIIDKPSPLSPTAMGKQPITREFEDWENLKELFAHAAERYDADDTQEALPLLRAVIRECHRLLTLHADPSVIYTVHHSRQSRSPEVITPTDERLSRDWGFEADTPFPRARPSPPAYVELPTAFHALFGITLFLLGNLIAQDPTLALPGEPSAPSTYWLAALDVFETGENLPSRIDGHGADTREDWRMAIVWGRTLVCLADEKVSYAIRAAKAHAENPDTPILNSSPFSIAEPHWPPDSPFYAIAAARPPVTRRMSLYSASAHDIMVLAMDQFSRGIFHMPHPHYSHTHNPPYAHFPSPQTSPFHSHMGSPARDGLDPLSAFSRPRELFTIASEVLGVAERLAEGSERHYWAAWADSVFNQMKMEADMDAWRGPITIARGRCWLIIGSSRADEMENALEKGDIAVLNSPEAAEAREGLATAISFFEHAKGSASSVLGDSEDLSPLLAEALLTLANLTADENKREELYSRAQAEGGDQLFDTPDTSTLGDSMDES